MERKAAVIGGDKRAIYAARGLAEQGIECRLYGLEKDRWGNCNGFSHGSCLAPYLLSEALEGANIILLPIPYTRDKENLHTPLSGERIPLGDLFSQIPKGSIIFGGGFPGEIAGCRTEDFLKNEEFAVANALPTAESAVALAMLHYEDLLYGSRCAVLGYGKIGQVLCRRLSALGGKVKAFARREESRRQAKLSGIEAHSFEELPAFLKEIDIFFATVPSQILDRNSLSQIPTESLYIELASAPYGIAENDLGYLPCKRILAPGLPGKYSPRFAGRLIAQSILNTLSTFR